MKVNIEDVKVSKRIRQDETDVTMLKESIREIGLLNPIIINEENELLAGFRRLEACKQLGWKEIETRMINTNSDEIIFI